MNSGLILDQQKERTTRLLNSFKTRADADKQNYRQFDSEAVDIPPGDLGIKLGEVYYVSVSIRMPSQPLFEACTRLKSSILTTHTFT